MTESQAINTSNPYELMERATRRPWEAYVPPFKMAPGVFYISGNDWVGAYLIDTGDGLILIDTAMHETLYLLLENVRKLGYTPADIKKILVSHAHIDHIGGARSLKELTGATLYLGERDLQFLKRPDLLGDEGKYTCGSVEPDELYADDKPICLGSIEIRTVSTPGHTPGCTSFFFNTRKPDGRTLRCGMHGGVGLNTMGAEYFRTSGQPVSLRGEFIASLEKLDCMDVDVCLPSHTNQVDILSLRGQISEDFNPYENDSVWHVFLRDRLKKVRALIALEGSGT